METTAVQHKRVQRISLPPLVTDQEDASNAPPT